MTTAETIKAAFLDRFGSYPVIHIDEYRDTEYDAYDYSDYADLMIDVELLDRIDDFELRYVQHLFEAAEKQVRNVPEGLRASTTTSRKYSFGDTLDWWTGALADDLARRIVIEFEIGIHS